MLMMKTFGLISVTVTTSSFSNIGDAATRDELARKALTSREKRIVNLMSTTVLALTHSQEL